MQRSLAPMARSQKGPTAATITPPPGDVSSQELFPKLTQNSAGQINPSPITKSSTPVTKREIDNSVVQPNRSGVFYEELFPKSTQNSPGQTDPLPSANSSTPITKWQTDNSPAQQSAATHPSTVTVTVTGSGPSVDEARTSAIRQALQQTITQLVVVDRMINNDRIIRDKVSSTMNGFVDKFVQKSLAKTPEGFSMLADITVSASRIENFIGGPQGSTTSIEGSTLLAESDREMAQRKARGEIFDRMLRGFPASVIDVNINKVRPSDQDPNRLRIEFTYSYKPEFVRSFAASLAALSTFSCAVASTTVRNLTNSCPGWPAQKSPTVCLVFSDRARCFLLAAGNYCERCDRNFPSNDQVDPGVDPLILYYSVVDANGQPVFTALDQPTCESLIPEMQRRRGFYSYDTEPHIDLRKEGNQSYFVAVFNLTGGNGSFLIERSSIDLEKARAVRAIVGIKARYAGRKPVLDLTKEPEGLPIDGCSLLGDTQ